MRSYAVRENPIVSVISEILRYKQTNILLLNYKDLSYLLNILDIAILTKNLDCIKKYPKFWIMERKRSSGLRRFFTVACGACKSLLRGLLPKPDGLSLT